MGVIRRAGAVTGALLAATLVVPIAVDLALPGAAVSSPRPRADRTSAVLLVQSALSATIGSGSYNFTFDDGPLIPPAGGPATACHPSEGTLVTSPCGQWVRQGVAITGTGTTDTEPFAEVAVSTVGGLGAITLHTDGTTVWEAGGADYGSTAGSSDAGPGAPLTGFVSSVEGTLGPRLGALDMIGLASRTTYLQLEQDAITGAGPLGRGMVDGVPVTTYQVTLDLADLADEPGLPADAVSIVDDAMVVLEQQGYTGTSVTVSIDGAGFIRQTVATASFSDGSTQTSENTYSDFGCAGTVLMPGQAGTTGPPVGCASPDPVR